MSANMNRHLAHVAVVVLAIVTCLGPRAQAQTFSTIAYLNEGPPSTLIADGDGNLYGTGTFGGPDTICHSGCGAVFELSPGSNGWTQTVLHQFEGGGGGFYPSGALVFDAEGNLYGTTQNSGTGAGTIFELSPTSSGFWTFRVLHEFTGGEDGGVPASGLISDSAGNVYGTATAGGDTNCRGNPHSNGCGVIFKLERTAKGGWAEIVLHTFARAADGANPRDGLTWGPDGNLYGTTTSGGDASGCGGGCGVVFRLVPRPFGIWKYTPIHIFTGGKDGGGPNGTLVFDAAGALYGATFQGGEANFGVVFQLSPTTEGGFVETALSPFGGIYGSSPTGVIFGPSGVLYGTAGPDSNYSGVLFSFTPTSGGWTYTVLHTLGFSQGELLLNGGNLYGVTDGPGYGDAFEFVP